MTGGFTPPAPEALSAILPDLVVEALIGQGGMGAVYRARQKRLDRAVALKILPAELGRDPAFAGRFEREALALARLNHPNLVTIHDVGRAGEWCYLVMELVEGATLREVLRTGRLSPREALAVIPQLCDALQYAHDAGVVHRDIKPENILLDRRGRVKIADFGLAKLIGPGDGASLTRTGMVLGTVHYMAPEQVEGSAAVDHRADIYSLGVVFYEMLTGGLPLGRFDPPSRRIEIDVRLDEVVLRTLEKDPAKRFQKAGQVQQAVEAVRDQAPQPAPVPPPAPPPVPQIDPLNLKVGNIEIGNGRVRIGDAICIDDAGVRIGKRWIGKSSTEDEDGDDDDETTDPAEAWHSQVSQSVLLGMGGVATAIVALPYSGHWLGATCLFAAPAMLWGAWCLYHRLSVGWAILGAYCSMIPAVAAWGVSWWLGLMVMIPAMYVVGTLPRQRDFVQPPPRPAWGWTLLVGCICVVMTLFAISEARELRHVPQVEPKQRPIPHVPKDQIKSRLAAIEPDSSLSVMVLSLMTSPWLDEALKTGEKPQIRVVLPTANNAASPATTKLRQRLQALLLATGLVDVLAEGAVIDSGESEPLVADLEPVVDSLPALMEQVAAELSLSSTLNPGAWCLTDARSKKLLWMRTSPAR